MSYDDYGERRHRGERGGRRRDEDDGRRSASRSRGHRERERDYDRRPRRDVDDWNDRAGLSDGHNAYTPSVGRRQRSRGGSRAGSDDEVPNDLMKRVEALEEQVRSLKNQNRMFLTFMQATEERITQLREQARSSGARTPRDGRSTPRGSRPQERRPPPQESDDEEDIKREKERKRREIARTNRLRLEKRKRQNDQRRQQTRDDEEDEDDEEEPSAYPKRAPQKRKPAPQRVSERSVGGGGNSIYEMAAQNPDAMAPVEMGDVDPRDFKPCRNCGRKFNPEALKRHISKKICQKKARKVFNMADRRVEEKAPKQYGKKNEQPKKNKKSNWRQERARLQEAIQAGKKISKVLKNGGNLADLPPVAASDPSLDDRTPCPHCGRKFNADVAERHIPHCANTKNRARPPPNRRTAKSKPAKGNNRRRY